MTTDFLAFHKYVFVEEAIEKIRSLAKKQFPFSYIYLIRAPPDTNPQKVASNAGLIKYHPFSIHVL